MNKLLRSASSHLLQSRPLVPHTTSKWTALFPRQCSSATHKDSSPSTSSDANHRHRVSRRDYRFIFPEFLPDPAFNHSTVERLKRKDMIRRRERVEIPEFYVGSVIAVTTSDPNSLAANKMVRFVGLVTARGGTGPNAWVNVRNVVDNQGIEFLFDLYSPTLQKIETLKLEKRLDEDLSYLRDALPEYSTIPLDLEMEILPEGQPVPINDTIVKLKPKPWSRNWERYLDRFCGYVFDEEELTEYSKMSLSWASLKKRPAWNREVEKYDLMMQYRETIPMEEQDAIWAEVGPALERRGRDMRKVAAKRAFVKPEKD